MVKYAFLGATKFSYELLQFLVDKGFKPTIIFYIPEVFKISYGVVKNFNFANVKELADRQKIPSYEVNSGEGKKLATYRDVIAEQKLDLLLACGWYYMIPRSIRELARYGAWGIHASLLPNYAGGAPLVWAMINGEPRAGVTLFRMDDGVDDGDIIDQKSFEINYEDTIKEVYDKATNLSKIMLIDVFKKLDKGEPIEFQPQPKDKIRIFPQRKPEDGLINWDQPSRDIYNFIRAQTIPYPCAYSYLNGKKIKIVKAKEYNTKNVCYEPGTIVKVGEKILVACKDNFMDILVINDGEGEQDFASFVEKGNLINQKFQNEETPLRRG